MKIACVDKTASERMRLQRLIDNAYEACRSSVGHLSLAHTYPATKDEVLLGEQPDVAAIGPGFGIEEAYTAARAISSSFPGTAVFVFLEPEFYNLRVLRRFQKTSNEVFSTDDLPIRIIHRLTTLENSATTAKTGRLIAVTGVKGGVGATSIVSALAHASQAVGKSAVVVDLSLTTSLVHYMSAQRWQSPDYAALLVDCVNPDMAMLDRCLTTAANGITLLLPPTGSTEIREYWLRDTKRFEISLSLIELLRERFDIILVDMASAEGILPFAIYSRAQTNLLVTSNDPSSVHLLSSRLSEICGIPGDGVVQILLNMTSDSGLTKDDVLDFLAINEHFNETMAVLEPVPFDIRGRNWIGTGNTFYTECASSVQDILEDTLLTLLLTAQELEERRGQSNGFFAGLRRLAGRASRRKKRVVPAVKALPQPTGGSDASVSRSSAEQSTALLRPQIIYAPSAPADGSNPSREDRPLLSVSRLEQSVLYEAPTLVEERQEDNFEVRR